MKINTGINRTSLKENNLIQIVRCLHFQDDCTRVSLSRELGLTQAAITKLVNELISIGLVTETSSIESGKGRHPIRLKLNGDRYQTLAGRINRDYVSAGLYDLNGKMYAHLDEPLRPDMDVRKTTNRLKEMLRECMAAAHTRVIGAGLALPGPFDARHGRITLMSGFPGWNSVDLRHEMMETLDLPVFLDQDANCGALAELWYGEHRNIRNMVYIVGDRGVGAGIILNGQIYKGESGFAGELGHMSINCFGPRCECGNRGCLELYASTLALEAEYQRSLFSMWQRGEGMSRTGQVSAPEICRMVREGDRLACMAYEKTASYLAFGAVGIVNTLNPEALIFSDKITAGGSFFLEAVRSTLKQYLMPDIYNNLIVDTSKLQNTPAIGDPMLIGAGVLVLESLMETSPQILLALR